MASYATHPVVKGWLDTLSINNSFQENCKDYWSNDTSTLITSSFPIAVTVGNGSHIYEKDLAPAIESAEKEVLLVTCFWARSSALSQLSAALISLSQKALARSDRSRIRVRLCLSSRSFFQKLFHSPSETGYTYPPSTWNSVLGLPPPSELKGLDFQVKSMFFRPFSVLHPKFLVIDRQKALMPSCNVSWENWLECCLTTQGPVVCNIAKFWEHFWGREDFPDLLSVTESAENGRENPGGKIPASHSGRTPVFTIVLPSPHHSSFKISFPILKSPTPLTPLNAFLLCLLDNAQHLVHIITPNLTSQPVIEALLAALARGVDVNIITNRRMMILEQIVTAGTITEICMCRLKKSYLKRSAKSSVQGAPMEHSSNLLEEARPLGNLRISYYYPSYVRAHPNRTHIKCTAVDDEITVLGSGNMDRASWFTSQELGIALFGKEVTKDYWSQLSKNMYKQVKVYYESKPLAASTSDIPIFEGNLYSIST